MVQRLLMSVRLFAASDYRSSELVHRIPPVG